MDSLRIFPDKQQLAEAAAEQTLALLETAIAAYGNATWVLAGGRVPMLAYKVIANEYKNAIDWAKVTVIIGDERIGPLDGPENNWHAIDQVLLQYLPATQLQPESNLRAVDAARHYTAALDTLPKDESGLPRFDVVWLGVGEDGHTLSLFPDNDGLQRTDQLVIDVGNSPKPPVSRISLSLDALGGTKTALILTGGVDKRHAITSARSGKQLPIALAAQAITAHHGHVRWLLDREAAPTD